MTNDKTVTMSRELVLFESILGKKPDAFLHEPVYQVTESEVLEFARLLAASAMSGRIKSAVCVKCSSKPCICAQIAALVVERQETVPKHKFDTLVQHCKRLDAEIAQARAHVNEITLYQQNAVWFWQHDGEDYLQSLSCPIIIQPHHLRELLEGKAQHNPIASPPAPVAVDGPYAIAEAVRTALDRKACPNAWMVIAYEATVEALASRS